MASTLAVVGSAQGQGDLDAGAWTQVDASGATPGAADSSSRAAAADGGLPDASFASARAPDLASQPDAPSPPDSAQRAPTTAPEQMPPRSGTSADLQRAAPSEPVIDVSVVGRSKAQRERESAQAVTVVELERAQRESSDLGEVLARVQGINVRRQGALGANTRFSLNGLSEDQIRFFLDDVPLELAGFGQGIANVPLVMLERVVVYRGVLPIRFGADALGGAVSLVTETPTRGHGAGGSYQVGSFGTHRASLFGYHVHGPSGLFTRLTLYADSARNDYWVDVEQPNEMGMLADAHVRRFHDGYRALGGSAEVGFVKRPWAERLILRAFAMQLAKEIQSDLAMLVPYGGARYERANYGANLRYEHKLAHALRVEAVAGYAYQPTSFIDDSPWVYDWYGRRGMQNNPGETSNSAIDQTIYQHSAFARSLLTWRLRAGQRLELAITPTYTVRTGADHTGLTATPDPVPGAQALVSVISGLSYTLNVLDDLLENVVFGKSYVYHTYADETAPNGVRVKQDASVARFGVGDALRVRLAPWLYSKASYELATRLPRPDELFGTGVLIDANLELREETSHNANLELTAAQQTERAGQFRASVNGFLRDTHNQIVLIPSPRQNQRWRYDNIYGARSLGVEGNAGWTAPGDYLELDGNLTYVDFRNVSHKGTFGMNAGDRVPNRPYLFANTTTRGVLRALFFAQDELTLTWYLRYTHAFYRFWESAGLRSMKYVIPMQLTHALVLTYLVPLAPLELSTSLEAQNLTDVRVFDEYGIQKPGRAYYFKLSDRW